MKFGQLGGFTFCATFISCHFSSRKSYYENCWIQVDSKNMLTIQNKASSLCNYLLVIHCKDGLRNTLVKSILNCIKKFLINCADPPLYGTVSPGIHWKRRQCVPCKQCGRPTASEYKLCNLHADKYHSRAHYYRKKLAKITQSE